MFKIILILLIVCNVAFAKTRFTDADKAEFLKDVKTELAEYKTENQGKIDLQIIKPGLYEELQKYYKLEKFTKEEMNKIKADYEVFAKDSSNNDETKFYAFIQKELDAINATEVAKIKVGEICNSWSCEEGLRCAVDPLQKNESGSKCLAGAKECSLDSDCCSGSCLNSTKAGSTQKFCASIKRCFVPVTLGGSCAIDPVCETGSCLPYDANTIGIGECTLNTKSCKSNTECCSNLCSSNKCVENLVCKDCAEKGKKLEKGKKCCEGLYKNSKGYCVPDVPPTVPPQVNNDRKSILKKIVSLVIPSAIAGDLSDAEVRNNQSTYSSQKVKREDTDAPSLASATSSIGIVKKSDFDKCDMHFREDFYKYLIKNNLFDLEVALLAFDFVMSGEDNSDYWMSAKGSTETSIYGRLKKVSTSHLTTRAETNTKITEINRKLTCMCIDAKGVANIADQTKVDYFNTNCSEYTTSSNSDQVASSCSTESLTKEEVAYKKTCEPLTADVTKEYCADALSKLNSKKATCASTSTDNETLANVDTGTASGVKGKKMLVYWTSQMETFNQTLTIDNTKIYQGIANVNGWITDSYEKFNTVETKTYDLNTFTIRNPSGSAAALGAVLGAILAAGIVAFLGGFSSSTLLTSWATAGIITSAAASGAVGIWLLASLKGAWVTGHPEIYDSYIKTYGCGKKDSCSDYTRQLKQPYNNVCDSHVSPSACVKNFVVYKNDNGDYRYVVDPFIPYGISKSDLIKNQGDYAKKMNTSFNSAYNYMKSISASGEISESYMSQEFITEVIAGFYAPDLGSNAGEDYLISSSMQDKIKAKAKAFAIAQEFLEESDTENLQKFADYAYTYHFLWPKTSRKGEISYPTVALETYLDFMSNGVAASLSAGGTKAAVTFGGLNAQYLQDYVNTLSLYKAQASTVSGTQTSLNSAIASANSAIASNKALKALIESNSLDNTLSTLNANKTATGSTTTTSGAVLSSTQLGFLNAVSNYRTLRNAQVAKLAAFNSAVGSSSTRQAAVTKALSTFKSKFNGATTAAISSKGSSGTNSTGSKSDSTVNVSVPTKGDYSTSVYTGSNSSSSGTSSGYSTGLGSKSTSSTNNAVSASTGEDEDARKLREAIEARNRSTDKKFESTDEDTIFKKVTNAYIRNYDKVLTKKKTDKDVSE